MTAAALGVAAVFGCLAVALFAVAGWGRRNQEYFIRTRASAEARSYQAKILRRGVATCYVSGGLMILSAVAALLSGFAR